MYVSMDLLNDYTPSITTKVVNCTVEWPQTYAPYSVKE